MEKSPIIIERVFDAPISMIWNAISDKTAMKKWYFDLAEFKPEVGFQFSFLGGKDPEHPYVHLCEVREVIPGKKLSYSWKYEGYAGNSLVTFELFEAGDQTRLVLTHSGLESFPKENPDLAKENFVQGWTQIVHTALYNYLNS